MTKFIMILIFLALPALAERQENRVCVLIDLHDTGHDKYPNIATEVDNVEKFFNVHHKQKACFDLKKHYYLQYFLWEDGNTTMYGTRCRYEPKPEDEGKLLRYEGESGDTLCPVVDEIHIDN